VGSLLTGSVQRADGQVRINLSLIAANTGDIRWTEKYDRPLTNVFALQDEIARVVATKLLGSLGAKVAAARTETATPEVYAMFLQGQVLFNRRTSQSLHQAIRLLEDVTKKDPKFARAQALLAMSYAILPNYDFTKAQESFDRALDVAGHAIAVDSTVAESYTAMAWVHAIRGESKLGDALFRRSLALDSTVATTWGWYGLFALWKGDFPLATTRIAKAQELEPVSWVLRAFETQLLMAQRREAEAFALTERTIALDSTFALIFNSRSDALIALGRTAEAVTMLEKRVLATNATPYGETTQQLAYAYARAGKLAESRAVLDKMRAATGGSLPSTGLLAATLDVLGEHESAVALLDAAIKANDPWVNNYVHSERFDRLKKDPRAAALLARISSW
jgi:Tfp pilus assembly protein PilF